MQRISVLAFFLALALNSANATTFNVSFDEFGNGSTNYKSASPFALPSSLGADPTGGVLLPALIYLLPYIPVGGDVVMTENVGGVPVTSDVVRFTTINGVGAMLFYSDNGDGIDAPADNAGLPTNALTNLLTIQEVGPEGANGAIYTPTLGQPGYVSTDFLPTYNITSDSSVPEPGTWLLIAPALLALAHRRRRSIHA